jgi:nitrate reductase NapE
MAEAPGEIDRARNPVASRRAETLVFLTIAAFVWPVVAVGIVGGYGFLVWISQLVLGPPGPPN